MVSDIKERTRAEGVREIGNRRLEAISQWGASWAAVTKYYFDGQIKNNEMGGACCLYGGEENCV